MSASDAKATFETLRYDHPAAGVARIEMHRPKVRNAQDLRMTYELRDAFDWAVADASVGVIILSGAGAHFSAGHDLQGEGGFAIGDAPIVSTWGDFSAPAAEGWYAREKEIYLDITERLRNTSKATIAQVQGRCAAGGLMLAWACDLIVAAEDASFIDAVVDIGMPGVEYFAHPFELGVRKAKELLFTGSAIGAHDARALGMVNRVVPNAELEASTLALAASIAAKPRFAIKMLKEAINHAEDTMGRRNAMTNAFSLHQLAHAHNRERFGLPIDPRGLPEPLRSRVIARIEAEIPEPQLTRVKAALEER